MNPEEIRRISRSDPETIERVITALVAQVAQVEKLEARVKELERQLKQNSQNSSKPPSSDGFRKLPPSSRKTGGKKEAPHGHPGTTLHWIDHPDKMIRLPLHTCPLCQSSLKGVSPTGEECRQVFDLPTLQLCVTEYRAEKKRCPHCHTTAKASFPVHVKAHTQYGESCGAMVSYLHQYQLLPLERIGEFFQDVFGHRPSEATLLSYVHRCAQGLASAEETIREQLLASSYLHADESGVRVEGKAYWMHVVSNANWTLLHVHRSRGLQAVKEQGILPVYTGCVIHDSLPMYFHESFPYTHGLCGAHLIRECQGIVDNDGHLWAVDMKALLQEACHLSKEARRQGVPLTKTVLASVEQRYDEILQEGQLEWGPPKRSKLRKGRLTQTKAASLGNRFMTYKSYILRFLHDAVIPFDNNQAERDLRMVKVKQKISGSIRTMHGAEEFARIRSVISSLRKQSRPILPSLLLAIQGQFSF